MQKGLAPILIILLIAVAVGGYFLYTYNSTNQTNAPQQTIKTSPAPTDASPVPNGAGETANPDSIGANWKTYINSVIGFEIKYPDGWEYSEVKAGNPLHLYFYPKHGSDIKSRDSNEALAPIELIVLNDSSPLQCLAEDSKSCLDLKVNGVFAKRYSRKSFHEVVAFKNKKDNLFFELMSPKFDKDSFALGSYKEYYKFYNLQEEKRKKIFQQILSTFKFLDQNQVDIGNWITYSEKNIGATVKYPENWEVSKFGEMYTYILTFSDYNFDDCQYKNNCLRIDLQINTTPEGFKELTDFIATISVNSKKSKPISESGVEIYLRKPDIVVDDISVPYFLIERTGKYVPKYSYIVVTNRNEKSYLITMSSNDQNTLDFLQDNESVFLEFLKNIKFN